MSNRIPNIQLSSKPSKTTIITFKIIHFFFSLNFGFVQGRWGKYLSLFIYIVNSSTLTFYVCYNIEHWDFFEFLFSFGIYLVYFSVLILILHFNGKKLTFYEYLCRLQTLDSKLLSKNEKFPNFGAKLCIISLVNMLLRVTTNYVYCSQYGDKNLLSFYVSMYYLQLFSLTYDIVAIVNCLIFDLAYYRLNKFVNLVKEMKKTFQRINENYYVLYKELVDLTEEIKTAFDLLVTIVYLSN